MAECPECGEKFPSEDRMAYHWLELHAFKSNDAVAEFEFAHCVCGLAYMNTDRKGWNRFILHVNLKGGFLRHYHDVLVGEG